MTTGNKTTITDKLPVVARLYYTGDATRRYRRASTRNGPGEPLCFVSVAQYRIDALTSRIAELEQAATAAQPAQAVTHALTPKMIEAAYEAHYGKERVRTCGGAAGIDMTVDGVGYNGVEAFTRMWNGALGVIAPVPADTEKTWRCFHCDEFFTDEQKAREHFGRSEIQNPACTIDIAAFREMEALHREHCDEDTDLHREIYSLQARHGTALMREEERGYRRGLQDAVSPMHVKVVSNLVKIASETFHLLDNSEEREGDDGLELVVSRTDFEAVSDALDLLDELADDQPGVVMGPAAKAEWALRDLRYCPFSAPQSTCGKGDESNIPTPTVDSNATIVDGFLSIRIPVETLTFAAQHSDYFFNATENGEALVITDQSNFAKSVAHALNVEGEDGSTPVTRMLDKAFVWVVEQGEEGISIQPAGRKE